MSYQEIGFSTGVVLYVIEKIVDPLAKLEHGFAAFISADKILFIFAEDITVSWCGFIFSKILFLQPWLHSCRNAGHLGNVFRSVCRAHQRRIKDLIDSQVFLCDLAAKGNGLLMAQICPRNVCGSADLIFYIPDGLSMSCKIEISVAHNNPPLL